MYLPKNFEETRVEVLHELMRAHPFAALVTHGDSGLNADHLPFMLDPEPAPYGTLRGHIARANPLWQTVADGAAALVLFQGPESYITPSWYTTKQETGMVVPTWNYAVVHAQGPLRFIDDRGWLRDFVSALTDRHEAGRPTPWAVRDAPDHFIDTLAASIIGVELTIARLIGKWKVSQNRPPRDRDGVVAGLHAEGSPDALAMAELVQRARGG